MYRRYAVGLGIAAGPIIYAPLERNSVTWYGFRYAPSVGDAMGTWGKALVGTAKYDVLWSSEGWAAFAHLAFGIDGNLGGA
jgi:hypothetical protein